MKNLVIILILLMFSSTALAATALTWDDNPPEQAVDMYQVEIDGQVVADIVPNTWVIVNVPDGNHDARVRAHNAVGWSAFSNALNFDLPYAHDLPTVPTSVRVIEVTLPTP